MAAAELSNYPYDQRQQALSSSTNDPYASVGYGQPSVSIPPFASTSLERTYRRDDPSHNLWIVELYNRYLAQGLSPADAENKALVEARAQQDNMPRLPEESHKQILVSWKDKSVIPNQSMTFGREMPNGRMSKQTQRTSEIQGWHTEKKREVGKL